MATVTELQDRVKELEVEVVAAYQKGLNASREFDAEMDTFLVKFMKRDDSSVIVFAIALGLVLAGGIVGYIFRGLA